jgi:hypothetical protein
MWNKFELDVLKVIIVGVVVKSVIRGSAVKYQSFNLSDESIVEPLLFCSLIDLGSEHLKGFTLG